MQETESAVPAQPKEINSGNKGYNVYRRKPQNLESLQLNILILDMIKTLSKI